MALLDDQLTVWEIGYRWAGFDPADKLRLRIPLAVRDNFRILIHEILEGHINSYALNIHKYHGNDPDEAKFYIRHWYDSVTDCSDGKRFDRELLKWATIDRDSMQEWCECRKVQLPEFWFPNGWNIEYEWPDDTPEKELEQQPEETTKEHKVRLDENHRWKMACQQIAIALWSKNPALTIKEVASSPEVQNLGGGNNRQLETVQEWIKEFDPREPSKKRGAKRKNNSSPANTSPSQPTEK